MTRTARVRSAELLASGAATGPVLGKRSSTEIVKSQCVIACKGVYLICSEPRNGEPATNSRTILEVHHHVPRPCGRRLWRRFSCRIARRGPRSRSSTGGSADEAARAEIGVASSDAAKDRLFRATHTELA